MSQTDYSNVQVYTGMPVPQDNSGFFQPPAPSAGAGHALASVDEFRAIAEVQASRRIRACILQIIPGDVTEEAMKACESTIKKTGGDAPLVDRVRKMAAVFQEYGVTTEMLGRRLGHNLNATIEQELVQLRRIYTSIKDGAAKREEFFDLTASAPADPAPTTEGGAQRPAGRRKKSPAQDQPADIPAPEPEAQTASEPQTEKCFAERTYPCPRKDGMWADEEECFHCKEREGCPSHA